MHALPETQLRRSLPELLDLLRVILLDQLIVNNEKRVSWYVVWERWERYARHCVQLAGSQAERDRKIKAEKRLKISD